MSENCLELKNVCKSIQKFKLNNLSFTLPKGYIMGLVGPNGAGKTTTIQLILNMLEKDAGEILVFDKDNVMNEQIIKQEIGVVFDSVFYVDSWTVSDTEKAVSIFYNNWQHDIFNDMIKRFNLPQNKKVSELSRGMQTKLMLACAFSHNAKLLILDEPTSGLDPVARDEFLEILQDYIKDGEKSVLFSTHITTDLERVADYITLVNQGNLIFTGSMENLSDEYQLIKGRPQDLTPELERSILGLRKTDMGFEGLITTKEAAQYKHCIFDNAAIDDIIICINRGGQRNDWIFENYKTGFLYNEITAFFVFIIGSSRLVIWIYGIVCYRIMHYRRMVCGINGHQYFCNTRKKQSRPPIWYGFC